MNTVKSLIMQIENITAKKVIYYLLCVAFFSLAFGTTPFTIAGLCILLVWFISGTWIKNWRMYFEQPVIWPLLAWVILTGVGLIYTPDIQNLGLKYAKKSYYWLFAFSVMSVSLKEKSISILIKAFLLGLFLNSIVGFFQWFDIIPENAKFSRYGATGFYGGYNTLAVFLILGVLSSSFFFIPTVIFAK